MTYTLRSVLVLLLCAVSSFAVAAASKKPNPLDKFTRTGKTVRCLETHWIQDTKVVDDHNILFTTSGSKYYLNHLQQACPQLSLYRSFTYTLQGQTQLCNMDIITVLTGVTTPQGILHGASCGLGKFEKLEKKAG